MKNDDFFNRGERLKEERKRLDIKTQDELAEILGVRKNSVVRYEKHNDPLNTDQLDKLEDHGFNIAYILWGTKKQITTDLSDAEQKLLSIYRDMNEKSQDGLILIAETYAKQFK